MPHAHLGPAAGRIIADVRAASTLVEAYLDTYYARNRLTRNLLLLADLILLSVTRTDRMTSTADVRSRSTPNCACLSHCQCPTELTRLGTGSTASRSQASHSRVSSYPVDAESHARHSSRSSRELICTCYVVKRTKPEVTDFRCTIADEKYADVLFAFSRRKSAQVLFSGESYKALSDFLGTSSDKDWLNDSTSTTDGILEGSAAFVVLHDLNAAHSHRHRVHSISSFNTLLDVWQELRGNRVLFLRGYPSRQWLCRLGAKLDLDYDFLNTHFSNESQFNVAENYCYPLMPTFGSNTIRLTFTSLGVWDNYHSGIQLAEARKALHKEMKAYKIDLNKGEGLKTGHSIVRDFHLHDLRHFSIEQMLTISLMPHDGHWTSTPRSCTELMRTQFGVQEFER